MDTNLRCDATRCIHNNSNYCYAGRISIDGRLADDIDDTYCSTFREKDYQQFTSSISGDNKIHPTTTQNIKINSGNASCDMFVEK